MNRIIVGVVGFIVEIIFTVIITNILGINTIAQIPLGILIGFSLFSLSILIALLYMYFTKAQNETRFMHEIECLKNKLSNSENIQLAQTEGNRLFLMSLSQNIDEPLKYKYLIDAVENYNNVLAGLHLGNLYESGVTCNNEIILQQDIEKATKIYKQINPYDEYGVSDWLLGWMYEKRLIESAKEISINESYEYALRYYEKSAEKGYPKALNSLGNLQLKHYRDNGNKIGYPIEAVSNYKEAADKGDVYAILNYGHYYLDKYRNDNQLADLELAKHNYKIAATYGSPEGCLKLGFTYEELYKVTDEFDRLIDAKRSYIDSFQHSRTQFGATGYCLLGCLINAYPEFNNDEDIKNALSPIKFDDLAIDCFIKSYELFQTLSVQGKETDIENKHYYNLLFSGLKNIKT